MPNIDTFISRWQESGAAERANFPSFAAELCDLLDVPRPEPTRPDESHNAYVFERNVTFHHADGYTSTGRIDLFKCGCFVREAKQDDRVYSPPKNSTRDVEKRGITYQDNCACDYAI